MLSRNEHAQKRWGGHHQALDHWLEERQELLILYCQMAGLPPYGRDSESLPTADQIKHFCEILVDYVSTGHFEIYSHLIENAKISDEKAYALSQQVYPLISVTTEQALNFNDNYAEINDDDALPKFDQDLSTLGEALEMRMELEDKLLNMLEEQQALLG
ncbi:sigma D regulator [Aliidiomarina minuta]|uniref:Sigma D regulator n=1 Tax=Aliidiomarina minuta TaxID=880057 RepID=A0A432W428_9GAMM|nr:sigma D regulator [Aliidiomarina minuta]RUO24066.1 sigma D regulator [Aliidiomarina minuta]